MAYWSNETDTKENCDFLFYIFRQTIAKTFHEIVTAPTHILNYSMQEPYT